MAKPLQRRHGTRRVEPTPPEQQDRLAEQLSPGAGSRQGAAEVDEHNQHGADRNHGVVGVTGVGKDGDQQAVGSATALGDEGPEADEHALGGSSLGGNHRPMPAEHRQVEVALGHADQPLANPGPGDVVVASDLREGDPLGHLRHCAEDVAYVVGLTRQHIAGQNPLAGVACPATGQPHHQVAEARGGVDAAGHPAVGQVQVGPGAPGADAPCQNFV